MRASPLLSALSLAAAVSLPAGGAPAPAPLVPWAIVHQHEAEEQVSTVIPDDYAPILSGRSTVSAPIQGSGATRGPLVPRTISSQSPRSQRSFLSAASGWTSIGPNTVQFPGGTNDAGRVTGIAMDPKNANVFYIAAAGGGVWKTTDGGGSYVPLTDFMGDTAMGSIAVAPSNHLYVYAGTGSPEAATDSKYGIGLFKSMDGGTTWSVIPGPGGAFFRKSISKIVVDPIDPGTVYLSIASVGTNGLFGNTGIWKTTDGGSTWANTTALAGLDNTDPYTDLVMDPLYPGTLYAAIGYAYDPSENGVNGVFKTTDGGSHWTKLGGGLPTAQVGRISLALAASAPQTLYASIAASSYATSPVVPGSLLGLYKTTTGGTSWTKMTVSNYLETSGFSGNSVVVSPTNDKTVFAGGVVNLIGSQDGGITFQDYTVGTGNYGPHVDLHALTFTTDGTALLDGSDGGVWRLGTPYSNPKSDGVGVVKWADLNASLDTIQFYGIALDPNDPKTAYGGSQDNGTDMTTGALTWTELEFGDGLLMRVDQSTPKSTPTTVYAEFLSSISYLERSDDGGGTWTPIGTGSGSGLNPNGTDKRSHVTPYKLDPNNQSRVIYGSDHIYESTNKGAKFTVIGSPNSNGFNPNSGITTALGVAGPPSTTTPGAIYAAVYVSSGTSPGASLYATTDDGTTWKDVSVPGLSNNINAKIGDIYVNPLNPADVIIAKAAFDDGTPGKIFRSTDGGATWANITGNLLDEPFNAIAVDKIAGVLYAGGDDGVYSSTDFGGTWVKLSVNLPDAQVKGLDLSNTTHLLGAGTYGRGMWTLPLSTVIAKPNVGFRTAFSRAGPLLTLTLTLHNTGTANTLIGVGAADAFNGAITSVTLTGSTGLPLSGFPSNNTTTVAVIPAYGLAAPLTYTFTVAPVAKTVYVLKMAGTYTGGSFGGTIRVTAP